MALHVGTSGYSYAPWKGPFYPPKLPAAKMLSFYASQLPAVEINNTFYRMPAPPLLERWSAETPEGFWFALKSPKRITHDKRLVGTDDSVKRFVEVAGTLGAKLGPTLFQLPPFLKKDIARLSDFLALWNTLAPGLRAAFEFRHESWFTDDVFALLRERGVALCVADAEDLSTPLVATAGWGYLRLRRQDYASADLAGWAERVRAVGWSDAWCFFKHEDEGRGPALAKEFRALMAAPASP